MPILNRVQGLSVAKKCLRLESALEILQWYCKLVILGILAMPPKAIAVTCSNYMQKIDLTLDFLKYITLKNLAVWLVWLAKNILGNKSRARILPDTGFTIESQMTKKNKWQNFQTNFGSFTPKLRQKWTFHKDRALSLFSIYRPLTSKKKLTGQFWEQL